MALLRLDRTDALIADVVIARAVEMDDRRAQNQAVRIANAVGRLLGGR